MQIQVNAADPEVRGANEEAISTTVENALERFAERITRVEVHVKDFNGPRGGAMDKRCTMEARLAGQQPIAVTHDAADVYEAVDGAAGKLHRAVSTMIDKLNAR